MELTELLSRMALELQAAESADETAETISQYARIVVRSDDAGLLLLHGRNRIETPTGTSPDVDRAHQLQAELGEGPCLEAVLAGGDHTYVVNDTEDDPRWSKWGHRAAELGYYSVISSSLETWDRRIGSLNVYSRTRDAFGEDDVETTRWLAAHASVALAAVTERAHLHRALSSRTMIGQAEGILMQAYGIDEKRALAFLKRLSQDRNVKLVSIAQEIIDQRGQLGSRNGRDRDEAGRQHDEGDRPITEVGAPV